MKSAVLAFAVFLGMALGATALLPSGQANAAAYPFDRCSNGCGGGG